MFPLWYNGGSPLVGHTEDGEIGIPVTKPGRGQVCVGRRGFRLWLRRINITLFRRTSDSIPLNRAKPPFHQLSTRGAVSLYRRTNPQFAQIYHPTCYYHLFNYIIPRCLSDTLCFTAFFIFNFTILENLDELPTFYFFAYVYFHCKALWVRHFEHGGVWEGG